MIVNSSDDFTMPPGWEPLGLPTQPYVGSAVQGSNSKNLISSPSAQARLSGPLDGRMHYTKQVKFKLVKIKDVVHNRPGSRYH